MSREDRGFVISVRSGTGIARTRLAAFDRALLGAGVGEYNLVGLSSVIPAGSQIRVVSSPLMGRRGDKLFCVRAAGFAESRGEAAWAGLGWVTDGCGGGVMVEHWGRSEGEVAAQIELSLEEMTQARERAFGRPQMALAGRTCLADPVCAVVVAAFELSPWRERTNCVPDPD